MLSLSATIALVCPQTCLLYLLSSRRFHGQLASAIVLARGIDDQGANAIFAAQPSPNMDLLPPTRSMAPLVQLPAPGVSSKPAVVLESAVPGQDSLPALHVDRPDMFVQAMASPSARKLGTKEAVSGGTDSAAAG